MQATSVGAVALLRGVCAPTVKSAAPLSVSSAFSSSVGQPGAIERWIASPGAGAGAGVPIGDGSPPTTPGKAP